MKNLEKRKINNSVILDFRTGSADGAGFIHGMSYTMGIQGKLKAFTFTFKKHLYTTHIYMESTQLT